MSYWLLRARLAYKQVMDSPFSDRWLDMLAGFITGFCVFGIAYAAALDL
jgi:hypothetical protein